MQTQKQTKSKSKRTKEDVLKALGKLESIATSKIPLQKKVDLMNQAMIKILKPTMN